MERNFNQKLLEVVEDNLSDENFGPEQLAARMGISYSSLHRRVKENFNKTLSQLLREKRLELAKELLQKEDFSVAEVAYQVGFGSPSYFNKCFHEYFGVAPGEYKKGRELKSNETSTSKKKLTKALSYISGLFFLIVFAYWYVGGNFSILKIESPVEISLAVLPVKYIGLPDYQYQAEGCMEEILDRLMKIEDLNVVSRTSVEKYRITSKSIKVIGKELKVSALLESTFQKTNEELTLYLKLYKTENERLIWRKKFEGNSENASVFHSEAAQMVAQELHVQLTPQEKQFLVKISDTNVEARDYFQQGMNQYFIYQLDNTKKEYLEKAAGFFEKALALDSTHAPSYAGLATMYWEKNYNATYFDENFLDSAFQLAQSALDYDEHLEEAYLIRGKYFYEMNEDRKALKEILKALEINPNLWEAYSVLSQIYTWRQPDFIRAIQNGQKAVLLNQGNGLANLQKMLGFAFSCAGVKDEAIAHFINSFDLSESSDSSNYFLSLGTLEQYFGNYFEAEKYLNKALEFDSTNVFLLRRLGGNYHLLRNYGKSLYYYTKWMQQKDSLNILDLGEAHRIGLAYHKTGQTKKADEYFTTQVKYCLQSIEKNRDFAQSQRAYYDLAAVYAFLGKKEEAYQLLDKFIKNESFPLWWVNLAKDDPLFEKIAHEKRFNELLALMEKKYLAEHERVKNWMEENDFSR